MAFAAALLTVAAACQPKEPPAGPGPSSAPAGAAEARPLGEAKDWREAFGRRESIQRVRPEHTDAYLNNPHKGTTTFQRFNGDPLYPGIWWNDRKGPETFGPPANRDLSNDRYPPTRIAYCRWVWRVLEPAKGRFHWEIIDKALKTAAARGQTLQLRVQPFVGNTIPAWYWKTGARRRGRRSPDHNDPLYLKHWGEFIRALGRRYDGHPALESVDVAYGGSCGESGGNASTATARKLVDVYLEAFPKTQLVSMIGTRGCAYAGRLKDRHFGWRADCFGDLRNDGRGGPPDHLAWNHMYDAYPLEVDLGGIKDAWKTAPVTLETCWTVPYWRQKGWDLDAILEQGLKYHPSVFMPKSVYIPDEWMGKIMEFNKRLGYRFCLHQMVLPLEAAPGQRFAVPVTIDNKGVAPIYRPYRFALRFTQAGRHHVVKFNQDIRKWMPDFTSFRERIVLPPALKPGVASVSCSIVDDRDRPVVRLAIKAVTPDGWHPLTSIDVK